MENEGGSTINPLDIERAFAHFLLEFQDNGVQEYHRQVHILMQYQKRSLYVDFMHIKQYNEHLALAVEMEYYRYWYIYFYDIVTNQFSEKIILSLSI